MLILCHLYPEVFQDGISWMALGQLVKKSFEKPVLVEVGLINAR